MFVYAIGPIDFWQGWNEVSSLPQESNLNEEGFYPVARGVVEDFIRDAQIIAEKYLYWEGDIRNGNGPFWIPLPIDESDNFAFAVAWKQDNNGQTFVASMRDLSWLRSDFWPRWEDGDLIGFNGTILGKQT